MKILQENAILITYFLSVRGAWCTKDADFPVNDWKRGSIDGALKKILLSFFLNQKLNNK